MSQFLDPWLHVYFNFLLNILEEKTLLVLCRLRVPPDHLPISYLPKLSAPCECNKSRSWELRPGWEAVLASGHSYPGRWWLLLRITLFLEHQGRGPHKHEHNYLLVVPCIEDILSLWNYFAFEFPLRDRERQRQYCYITSSQLDPGS